MHRTSGEGRGRTPVGIEAGRAPLMGWFGRWRGILTICAFMLSGGLVAGVTLHSWQPELARSPYRSLPYSAATAPPVGDIRPLPDVVPVPLAQPPPPQPAPTSSDTSPPAPGASPGAAGVARRPGAPGQVAPMNRPAQLLGLTPGSVSFDPTPTGTTGAARTVTVASTGSAPLHIRGVALGGTNVASFAVSGDHCSGATLAPGASCGVAITFTPDMDGGRSASLSISGDGVNSASIALSGTATDAPLTATALGVDCGDSSATRCAVSTMYRQLLGRAADPQPLQTYAAQIDAGQNTRQQVAVAIQGSDEWRTRLIGILFKQLLGRSADSSSVGYYMPQLRSGTVEDVTAAIAASQEYFTHAGGTNDGYVGALYRDFLRHAPDPAGRAGWVDQLNRGASRVSVATSIRKSAEAQGVMVQAATRLLLSRAATGPEQTNLSNAMVHGLSYQSMVGSLIQTDEYLNLVSPLALTDVSLASFVDGDPHGAPGDYSATIDWGDGSPPASAVVKKGSKGGFAVIGSHTYSAHRTWTATVHITDTGGSQTQATTTVVV